MFDYKFEMINLLETKETLWLLFWRMNMTTSFFFPTVHNGGWRPHVLVENILLLLKKFYFYHVLGWALLKIQSLLFKKLFEGLKTQLIKKNWKLFVVPICETCRRLISAMFVKSDDRKRCPFKFFTLAEILLRLLSCITCISTLTLGWHAVMP